MKIFILPVPKFLQPDRGVIWPPNNLDYGVEQDFLLWLLAQGALLVASAALADWHYLPVFWNRFYMAAGLGTAGAEPSQALADGVRQSIVDPARTFTVCEFDPYHLTRNVDLDGVMVFTANRVGKRGIDVPLLRNQLYPPEPAERRVQLATFIGHRQTHRLRAEMFLALRGRRDCHCEHGNRGLRAFARQMRMSHIALAPRGDGAQSFRMYEAMEFGTAPLYLSDIDARPFRRWLDWDAVSLYRRDCDGLYAYMAGLDKARLLEMGNAARRMYYDHLQYGKWCEFVVKELEAL